jgi:hypothetical protein
MLIAAGVGITLYGSFYSGESINVNVTLDGGLNSTTPFVAYVTGPSISFYDLQSLPYKDHNATVLVLSGANNQYPNIFFDYAVVNNTSPGPSPPTSSRLVIFQWIADVKLMLFHAARMWVQSLAGSLQLW